MTHLCTSAAPMPTLGKGAITAKAWLEDFLHDGPKTVTKIRDAARTAHFQWGTIRNAKDAIGAYSPRTGTWELPKEAA